MGETAQQPTASATRLAIPLVGRVRVTAERIEAMWAMRREERVAAAKRGEFTLGEMLHWAARRPHEVPLVAGEFFFITALSADDDDEALGSPSDTSRPGAAAASDTSRRGSQV